MKTRLLGDAKVGAVLDRASLERCFDPDHFIRHVGHIFDRVLGASLAHR